MANDVKIYKQVDRSDTDVPFRIKRMEEIYDLTLGQPDSPHRHNYYTLIAVRQGFGMHNLDFQSYELGTRTMHFVSPGQVHQIVENERPHGYVLTFAERFLSFNGIDSDFISRVNLFNNYANTPPLQLTPSGFERISDYCEEMIRIEHEQGAFAYQALGAYLKLLLILCNRECTLDFDGNTQSQQAGLVILTEFKKLVAEHFRSEHSVGFYADKLLVTSDHLNKTVRSLTGLTAKEYISSRIMVEAKRLLYFTSQSAKAIGYSLGFREPAHFSSFFKRETGTTVTGFRKSNQHAG